MIADKVKFWSTDRQTWLSQESAHRLALGVALGMMIGLIPKDSMLVYMLFVLLMVSTANLFCSVLSAFVFSWIGFLLDPFSHKLGGTLLTAEQLQPAWLTLYKLPLAPWTKFNNTVVMGSLVISLLLAYPLYRLSFRFFQIYGHALHLALRNNLAYRWLVAPAATAQAKES